MSDDVPPDDDGNAPGRVPLGRRARARCDARDRARGGRRRRTTRRGRDRLRAGADDSRSHTGALPASAEPLVPVPRERGRRGGRRAPAGSRRRARRACRHRSGARSRDRADHVRGRVVPLPRTRRAMCCAGSTSRYGPARPSRSSDRAESGRARCLALLLRLASPSAVGSSWAGDDLADRRAGRVAAADGSRAAASDPVQGDRCRQHPPRRPGRRRRSRPPCGRARRRPRLVSRLPDGYETVVGDGGRQLSAGQRRRLALARAFLRDAPLVVLDEPTADLDPASAASVAEAIERLRAGRTVVLVAHRTELVGALRIAIVRLERGRILADGGGGMTATIGRLLALAELPRGRVALSIALAACAVGFGVALMTTAGYLISTGGRAAADPVADDDHRRRALPRARASARALPRATRVPRSRLARHSAGSARRSTSASSRSRPRSSRRFAAATSSAAWSVTSMRSRASTCAVSGRLSSPSSSRSPASSRPHSSCRLRRSCSQSGSRSAGIAVPVLAGALARATGRRQAHARGELTAELVELLRGAPELVAYGREDDALARVRAADRELVRLGRRDALVAGLADALSILVAGLTTVGVLAVAVAAHDVGSLDRVLVAALALLALSSFDSVSPLPAAAREFSATLASGRRVLELTDREPAITDPDTPAPAPQVPVTVAARGRDRALPAAGGARVPCLRPQTRPRAARRPRRAERSGQDHRHESPTPVPRPRRGSCHDRRQRPS